MRQHFRAAKAINISFFIMPITVGNVSKGEGHTFLMTGKVGVTQVQCGNRSPLKFTAQKAAIQHIHL